MSTFKVIIKSEQSKLLFFGNEDDYESHLSERQKRNFKRKILFFPNILFILTIQFKQ